MRAVCGLTTRVCFPSGVVRTVPSGPVVDATSRGATRTPSLATVAITEAICTVLTE